MAGSRNDKILGDLKRLLADISQDVSKDTIAQYEKMIKKLDTLLNSSLVKNREALVKQISMTLITGKTNPIDSERVKASFDKLNIATYETNKQLKSAKIDFKEFKTDAPGNDSTPRRKIK